MKKTKTKKKATKKKATPKPVWLNLGAGDTVIPGFTAIDRKFGQEVYPLKYEDSSVDEIRASHILEHFPATEATKVLVDWVRVLKPGGRIRIAVPNFDFVAESYMRRMGDKGMLFAYVMGGQTDENDVHKSLYDEPTLRQWMESANLRGITRWTSDAVNDCARLPVSLNLEGYKREDRNPFQIPKTMAIMSTGRLGFTENMFCAMGCFQALKIDLIKHTGAFWEQCLTRVALEAIAENTEWLVVMDYDTVFMLDHLKELLWLMAMHPEADAIAPWQVKREGDDKLLFWTSDGDGEQRTQIPLKDFDGDLSPSETAHFGLTLIRVSALNKMKHPWFLGAPNKDGLWDEGRTDPDIAFWKKFKAAGNKLFMANHVSIGHLQMVATWPDQGLMGVVKQYVTDFQKNGPHPGARR